MLDSHRPRPVPPELAASVVATLPTEGEVKRLTVSDMQKLESVSAVLRPHEREKVYLIKVVDSPQARVGLHARFIVVASNTALRILSPVQFQAIVAHEIGHEYVWDEYESARRKGNTSRLRALELFCDGVAAVTLARIGVAPAELLDALRLLDASDRRNGIVLEDNSYPTLAERADFAQQIATWLKGDRSSSRHPTAAEGRKFVVECDPRRGRFAARLRSNLPRSSVCLAQSTVEDRPVAASPNTRPVRDQGNTLGKPLGYRWEPNSILWTTYEWVLRSAQLLASPTRRELRHPKLSGSRV